MTTLPSLKLFPTLKLLRYFSLPLTEVSPQKLSMGDKQYLLHLKICSRLSIKSQILYSTKVSKIITLQLVNKVFRMPGPSACHTRIKPFGLTDTLKAKVGVT
jgi:hypothetical protein